MIRAVIRLPRVYTLIPAAALLFGACGVPNGRPGAGGIEGSGKGALEPALAAAAPFAILGASTVTCTNASVVAGDVGVTPGTAITGFNPDCSLTGQIHSADVVAAGAHADALSAYGVLAAAPCQHNLTGSDLGGMTLVPGVYCFDSSAGLTGQLTLEGGGDANATWTFQMGSTLTTGSGASVLLVGGAQQCNVFWQVGSSATLGSGTAFQGTVIALASISLVSGTSLDGRALALSGAVTMDHNRVSLGECSAADAGTSSDGGSRPDAGSASDAGTANDAGTVRDAGTAIDAGTVSDAGTVCDAGSTFDAGGPVDAGAAPDAGATCDGGSVADAGAPDAGSALDAGCGGDW